MPKFSDICPSHLNTDPVLKYIIDLEIRIRIEFTPTLYTYDIIRNNFIELFQETSKEVTEMIDQLSLLSESAQNAKLVKNAYLDMERINEKVDQRKYLDAAALLQKLDNLICLDIRSPDDPVMRKSLASIGKELNTARWCDRSTLLAY